MELAHFRCILILFIWRSYSVGKQSPSDPPYCSLSSFGRSFPVKLIPQRWIFQLVSEDGKSDMNRYCLREDRNDLGLKLCDRNDQDQLWFQYENSLMNARSGRSIVVTESDGSAMHRMNPESLRSCQNIEVFQIIFFLTSSIFCLTEPQSRGSAFGFGNWSNNSSVWKCEGGTSAFTKIKVENNGGSMYFSEFSHSSIKLTPSAKTDWFVKSAPAYQPLESKDLLCKRRKGFCGLPIPGMNSFIVSASNWRTDFNQIPDRILHQASTTAGKLCYSGGETILYVCRVGYVQYASVNDTYRSSLCLGGGLWSPSKPLNCLRRKCGRPPDIPNATITRLKEVFRGEYFFEDSVLYSCNSGYYGAKRYLYCGPYSEWIGVRAHCSKICYYVITKPEGNFTSPNYPHPYPLVTKCMWEFHAPQGQRIVLWFRDFFLEQGTFYASGCHNDFISISEFTEFREPHPKLYCGSNSPGRWISVGNYVYLRFNSDDSLNTKGFMVQYIFWDSNESAEPVEPYFNFSNPDFLLQDDIFIGKERIFYTMEVISGLLIGVLLVLIIVVIARHLYCRLFCSPNTPSRSTADEKKPYVPHKTRGLPSEVILFGNESDSLLLSDISFGAAGSATSFDKEMEKWEKRGVLPRVRKKKVQRAFDFEKSDNIPLSMTSVYAVEKQYADEMFQKELSKSSFGNKSASDSTFGRYTKAGQRKFDSSNPRSSHQVKFKGHSRPKAKTPSEIAALLLPIDDKSLNFDGSVESLKPSAKPPPVAIASTTVTVPSPPTSLLLPLPSTPKYTSAPAILRQAHPLPGSSQVSQEEVRSLGNGVSQRTEESPVSISFSDDNTGDESRKNNDELSKNVVYR